ncbi:MAG: calcium-binding protein [Paracoccaceae bacterium]
MTDDVLFVGHSLVGPTMPRMLDGLLPASQLVRAQVINGAPLAYHWDHGASAEGVNARAVLPSGAYGTLILTEAIPLANHLQWSDTYGNAARYAALAWAANPSARVMIYETWHEIGSDIAAWRADLTNDLALWRGIASHVNADKPSTAPTVGIVPGGQALGLLYDTIQKANGLGLTSITQVFSDQIHLNDAGNYLISLVQYSAIAGRSGVGLTDNLTTVWGQPYTGWTTDQTILFQHIAWEAAARAPGARLALGTVLPLLVNGSNASETRSGGNGDDRVYGNSGADSLNGLNGHDLISGGRGNDRVLGGFGNDFLLGGADADVLLGDRGNDRLHGEQGNDTLTGGSGADDFVFTRSGASDRITDFSVTARDQLMLDDALWTGSRTVEQVVSSFAKVTADGVLFTFSTTDKLFLQGVTTTTGLAALIEIF